MAVIEPYFAIQQVITIPVMCVTCGLAKKLQGASAEVREALVTAPYVSDFKAELALLLRVQTLFARFPNSRHPWKIRKEYNDVDERKNTQADPAFEKALAEEPELKEFLRPHGFWLPARLTFVQDQSVILLEAKSRHYPMRLLRRRSLPYRIRFL